MRYAWVRRVVRGRVLEVGCAQGYAACQMASVADEVVAVDLDESVLQQARDLIDLNGIKNVSVQLGDAYSLPFASGSFDTVTLLEVLEHLERPETAVREALRVARHRVVVTVPARGHMTDVDGHIQDFELEEVVAMFPNVAVAFVREPFSFVLHETSPKAP